MDENRRQSGLFSQNDQGYFERQPQAQSGPYQYYEPPAPANGNRRSFSERTANGVAHRSGPSKKPQVYAPQSEKLNRGIEQYPDLTSDQLAGTKHVNSVRMPSSSSKQHQQQPLRVDPNAVPSNTRAQAWSPDPNGKPNRHASDAAQPMRRGSVPDRSPLQKLEYKLDDISKEEKRARIEEAEYRAAQRKQDRVRGSDKPRVLSDGSRRPDDKERRDERPRNASAGVYSPAVVEDGAAKFRRASDALRNSPPKRDEYAAAEPTGRDARVPDVRAYGGEERRAARQSTDNGYVSDNTGVQRTASGKYRHRARDAGFVGAAAAITGGAAERGKAAYERRKTQDSPANSPISPASKDMNYGSLGRSNSKKLQKRPPPPEEWHGKGEPSFRGPYDHTPEPRGLALQHGGKPLLQNDRAGTGTKAEKQAAAMYQQPDPIAKEQVKTARNVPVPYSIPPQAAAGQEAREQVGFSTAGAENRPPVHAGDEKSHRSFRDFLHRTHDDRRTYKAAGAPLEDWRKASVGKLSLADIELDDAPPTPVVGDKTDAAWWEKNGGRRPSTSGSRTASGQYEGAFEEEAQSFRPALFLKSGPLLRYTGLKTESASRGGSREVWRGSVMIVTDDAASEYSTPPVLRMFAQPMDLHQPPPLHLIKSGQELPPEDEDPISGQVKVSRTGRPLYVRPVHDIEPEADLSREENNHGLFSAIRTPVLGPQAISGPDGRESRHITFQNKSRIKRRDGERVNKYREVRAHRLLTERGVTFWRFNIEVELGSTQERIAYRINRGPAVGFWVPAKGESMNIMFHSCNGFSLAVDSDTFSGPDPLWRDVLNRHQHRPFHVMLGGGDQIYNDAAMRDTNLFREWLQIKNPEHKHKAEFTAEMQDELEDFYLNRYSMWFSQGLFGMANAQIPMVNLWDDHDIIDGFGSYPHHFMSTRVFTGLGAIAFKYYMLFQHQSLVAETAVEEPSWLLGASPGPYINELSRSTFMFLGRKVAFMGLDCRTERMRDEILSQESYDLIFDRARREIVAGQTKHLLVLLGVPIAYPRLNFLENILTSKVMDPIKALGRTGALGGFVNKFDGGVEILDDLDDHWTAKHHKAERNWFIQELQELAAEKSVRITILGGDVHLGAVGQFYSNKKLGVAKDRDHRYMPNIVSSAIVNTPPPVVMADVLNKRNKIHHLDAETDEDMIPMFDHDVDGSKRNNTHLLPRRNFCTIREYHPGTTPPPSPGFGSEQNGFGNGEDARRFPPGSMKRTMSLTRSNSGVNKLVRRFSGSGRGKNPPLSLDQGRPYSQQGSAGTGTPPMMQRSASMDGGARPGFHRRPTNLSVKEARKAAAKGGAEGNLDGREVGAVDLEGGLDVSLCMEIDQKNPAGRTERYRLLVPALWYEGPGDANTDAYAGRKVGFMERLRGRSTSGQQRGTGGGGNGEYSRSPSRDSQGRSLSPSPEPVVTEMRPQGGRRGEELRDLQATAAGAGGRQQNVAPPAAASLRPQDRDGYFDGAMQDGRHNAPAPYKRGQQDLESPLTDRPPVQQDNYPSSGYRRTSGNAAPLQVTHHNVHNSIHNNTHNTTHNNAHTDNLHSNSHPAAAAGMYDHGPPPGPSQQQQLPPQQQQSKPSGRLGNLFRRLSKPREKRERGNEGYGRERYGEESEGSYTASESDSGDEDGRYDVAPRIAQPQQQQGRHVSAPHPQQQGGGSVGQGRFYGNGGAGERRPSKAERFLGIEREDYAPGAVGGGVSSGGMGSGEGRRMSMQQEGGRVNEGVWDPERRRGSWEDEGEYEEAPRKKAGWKIWK